MRLNRLSELIHSSAEHPNVPYAVVTVHFFEIFDDEDTENFVIVPGTEFRIARKIDRNN